MLYEPDYEGDVEVTFEGIEVEAVQRAFSENIERLEALGNDSSVSEYQRGVAKWQGKEQTYRGSTPPSAS